MRRVGNRAAICLFPLLLLALFPAAQTAAAERHRVGQDGDQPTLAAALAAARTGDTIEVRGGTYRGPLVIDKPVSLIGVEMPVIIGPGAGTVITVTAPNVTIQGFHITGSGSRLETEDGAIKVLGGSGVQIRNNRITDALFGVYLKESSGSVVAGNTVVGKALDVARRGDPIRTWSSHRVDIENTAVQAGREIVIWFSDHVRFRGNRVVEGRYGIHIMYSHHAVLEQNILADNSVGSFAMYSDDVVIRGNQFMSNRGPSGYGIGLKDMERLHIEGNLLARNRVGIYFDNSPWRPDYVAETRGNLVVGNNIGLLFQAAVRDNLLAENAFIDNLEQVAISGGTTLTGNSWADGNRGNHWSDYTGYDANGDGLGDLPHQPRSLFENLMETHPPLRWYLYSPAALAVDLAARAFPPLEPDPKLTDPIPLMRAQLQGLWRADGAPPGHRMMGASAALALGAAGVMLVWGTRNRVPAPLRGAAAGKEESP